MSVYRLFPGGNQTYQGWNGSPITPYNAQTIATIKDPTGAISTKEITSIPSPFARIDLVKSAFAELHQACNGKQGDALRKELDGNTIYHKMVSDALDIGEIFFNLDKLQGKVEVLSWSPLNLAQQQQTAASYGQTCYADALQTYWKADAQTYNFDKVKNIYILNYKAGPKPLNIIGATSPATLFFSNANDLSYVKGIQFGQDKPFDAEFQPLYKRDAKYVEFLWWLRCSIANFSTLFPEVYDYLTDTFSALTNNTQRQQLLNIQQQPAQPTGLQPISASANNAVNQVEVLGNLLYQKVLQPVGQSDFTIRSTKQPQCKHLVLPAEAGNKYAGWMYTTSTWGIKNAAPASDPTPINQRRLPNDGTPQPYLTIGDFLENTIIVSPHKLNDGLFYNGGICGETAQDSASSCLLPLTPLFFQYFSADDLVNGRMMTIQRRAGGLLRVTLRIPAAKGNVEYSRLYTYADPDPAKNEGIIVDEEEMELRDIMIMPAVKTPVAVEPHYTLASIAPFGCKLSLTVYDDGKPVSPANAPQTRNSSFRELYQTTALTIKQRFECIQVRTKSGCSMAVPMLQEATGNAAVSFAVDLGTSNTHVEYVVDGNTKQCLPLQYAYGDRMQGLLFEPETKMLAGQMVEDELATVVEFLSRDMIPQTLSADQTCHFPTRTALSYAKSIDWNKQMGQYELANACFQLGKMPPVAYNNYATNIKWSDEANAQKQMEAYIESLLLLMRNKVLTLGGDLARTSLTWFYPTSMSQFRMGRFQQLWNTLFQRTFGENAQISYISESLAPVKFHTQNNNTAKDLLTIDIGGGTTDMAFSSKGKVECVTSFRFAANALFEDSFSRVNSRNGIVDYFKTDYSQLAEQIPDLKSILASQDTTPANLANTFFTMADVPCVRKENRSAESVDFISKIRNDHDFVLEVVVFYAAILYHAGKIMKAKGLPLPRHIAFSGNGSNILKVLATPDKMGRKQLSDFSKQILQLATGMNYLEGNKLDILGFGEGESPKASTCKGGLLQGEEDEAPQTLFLQSATGQVVSSMAFGEVDDAYAKKVREEVYAFFAVLKQLNQQFDFNQHFGVSSLSWDVLDDVLSSKDDVETFVHNGIEARKGQEDTGFSETFFFYPVASILQDYSLIMFAKKTDQ